MENKSHRGNYKGTTAMKAKNQDMAFVNDTIEDAKSVTPFSEKRKDGLVPSCQFNDPIPYSID
ncbi:hypothetical protein PAV_2c02490 [Paenibacillus alvei DSM 29]|uniref:hypothetical protein n=1 Tax=Paenibacillus alvei TaxID=44250 RepID=UPI00028A3666|nr:hypothetical protein [Paenibacillus alvei]EJW18485.1 hypothetical protein PAV_2c02490 [Paenibacillus alvei DSM 29]